MLRYHTYIIVILPHIVSQPHLHSLSHKRCRQSTLLSAGGTSTSFGAILIIAPVPFAHPCLPARCQPIGRVEVGMDLHAAGTCGPSMALRLDPLRLLLQSFFPRAVRRSGLLVLLSSRAFMPRLALLGPLFRPAAVSPLHLRSQPNDMAARTSSVAAGPLRWRQSSARLPLRWQQHLTFT